MTHSPDANAPQRWRDRARKARVAADRASYPQSKRVMLRIAEAYERLAQEIDARLRDPKDSKNLQ
jgi:hypothetical protein